MKQTGEYMNYFRVLNLNNQKRVLEKRSGEIGVGCTSVVFCSSSGQTIITMIYHRKFFFF